MAKQRYPLCETFGLSYLGSGILDKVHMSAHNVQDILKSPVGVGGRGDSDEGGLCLSSQKSKRRKVMSS